MHPSPNARRRLTFSEEGGCVSDEKAKIIHPSDPRADLAFAVLTFGTFIVVCLAWLALPNIVGMLLVSAVAAYAVLPLVDRIERFMPRTLAVLVIAVGLVGTLVLLVGVVTTSLIGELSQLEAQFAALPAKLRDGWESLSRWLPGPVNTFVVESVDRLSKSLPQGAALSEWAFKVGAGITGLVSALLFVPIFVFLMLRGFHPLVESVMNWLPPRWRPTFDVRTEELNRAMSGFVRGQLIVAGIIIVLYAVGFSIIRLPMAIAVGVVAGLGELVPFLGNILALSLGLILALSTGDPMKALWVVVVYGIVQTLQGALISPWIMGKSAKLGAMSVLVTIAIAGQLFGFLGLLLGVPGAVIVKASWSALGDAWRGGRFYRKGARV